MVERIGVGERVLAGDAAERVGLELQARGARAAGLAGEVDGDVAVADRLELAVRQQRAEERDELERVPGPVRGAVGDEEDRVALRRGRGKKRGSRGEGLLAAGEGERRRDRCVAIDGVRPRESVVRADAGFVLPRCRPGW